MIIPEKTNQIINKGNSIIIKANYNAELSLFDMNGKAIFNKAIKEGNYTIKKQYPVGEYVIRIENQNYTTFEKIQIIKK